MSIYEIHELDDLLHFTKQMSANNDYILLSDFSDNIPRSDADKLVRKAYNSVLKGNSNRGVNTIYSMTVKRTLKLLQEEALKYVK